MGVDGFDTNFFKMLKKNFCICTNSYFLQLKLFFKGGNTIPSALSFAFLETRVVFGKVEKLKQSLFFFK